MLTSTLWYPQPNSVQKVAMYKSGDVHLTSLYKAIKYKQGYKKNNNNNKKLFTLKGAVQIV